MGEHRGVERVVERCVQIGLEDTLLQVVEHDVGDRTAERAERFLV